MLKVRQSLSNRLAGQGVTVEWYEFASGPPLLEALNAGAIHLGHAGDSPPSDLRPFVEERLRGDTSNLLAESTEIMERFLLITVMRVTDGNQSTAAKILGISRGSLRTKLRALGIAISNNRIVSGEDVHEDAISDDE